MTVNDARAILRNEFGINNYEELEFACSRMIGLDLAIFTKQPKRKRRKSSEERKEVITA